MKNGKAPGENEITMEVVKAGESEILRRIKEIFNFAWRNETVPEGWGLGIMSIIQEKRQNELQIIEVWHFYLTLESYIRGFYRQEHCGEDGKLATWYYKDREEEQ